MTNFSPIVQLVQQTSRELLLYAHQCRKDRWWGLKPVVTPELPAEWEWSAPYVEAYPVRQRLSQGAAGPLLYAIERVSTAGVGLEWRGSQRRLRHHRTLLPENGWRRVLSKETSEVVAFRSKMPLPCLWIRFEKRHEHGPPQLLRIVIALEAMSARSQKKWRQRLIALVPPETAGHPAKRQSEGCQKVPWIAWLTFFRRLCGRSQSQRCESRKRLVQAAPEVLDHLHQRDAVLSEMFIARYLRGDRFAPCLLRVDQDTTEDDLTVQLLAYLLQDQMVLWEEIEAWVRGYAQQYGAHPGDGSLFMRLMQFALPVAANALRPVVAPHVAPDATTILQTAQALGLTERQLRYKVEKGDVHDVTREGQSLYISPAEKARLREALELQRNATAPRAQCVENGRALGVSGATIRQIISRGRRAGKSWEDINNDIVRSAARSGRSKTERLDTASRESLIATLEAQLRQPYLTENERIDILDKLQQLRRGA